MSKPMEYKNIYFCWDLSLFGLLPAESKRHHHLESYFPSVHSTCGLMNLTDVCTHACACAHTNTLTQPPPPKKKFSISRYLETS